MFTHRRNSHWVILDELNLASQPVLESLNSAFDHRGELFIPELNRSFKIDTSRGTRFFACQNPRIQGGGRKGLPKSFLNRFTRVYCDNLTVIDITKILQKSHCNISNYFSQSEKNIDMMRSLTSADILNADDNTMALAKLVLFNQQVEKLMKFSGLGAEFNLRDLMRICHLLSVVSLPLRKIFDLVYRSRIRNQSDRDSFEKLAEEWWNINFTNFNDQILVTEETVKFPEFSLVRNYEKRQVCSLEPPVLTKSFRNLIAQILTTVKSGWMTQLVGEAGSGKSTAVQFCADLIGKRLRQLTLSSATDVTDLLGKFSILILLFSRNSDEEN